MASAIELSRISASLTALQSERTVIAKFNPLGMFNGRISEMDGKIKAAESEQQAAFVRIGDRADLKNSSAFNTFNFQSGSRPNFGGNDFAARTIDKIANRDQFSPLFDTAFSFSVGGQMPVKTNPGIPSIPSNPSNASTKMQDGKAVYESDTYKITVDEKDSGVNIFNKRTKETYKAWGDPHMDVDGKRAFDFYGKTSLKLADGTKVTIDTVDADKQTTYSSKVTITNGDYGVQILGADEKKKGDLAIKEFHGKGRELDRKVDDGVVLEENENMTINDGRGFVVSDKNGVQTRADQDLINRVDRKKVFGESSQNVDQFDDIGNDRLESNQGFGGYGFQKSCEVDDEYDASPFEMALAPWNKPSRGKTQLEALQSLMNMLQSSWSEGFKSREKPREENQVSRQPQRPVIRAKVNVKIPEGIDNFNLKLALNFDNNWLSNNRVYG